METGEAITGLIKLLPLLSFSVLAFWRGHPVIYMYTAGIAIITGCYIPDILNGGVTDSLSLTVSLCFIGYALICLAFAFFMMFRSKEV